MTPDPERLRLLEALLRYCKYLVAIDAALGLNRFMFLQTFVADIESHDAAQGKEET